MATKRPIDAVHPSRRDQVTSHKHKKAKPDNITGRAFKKAHPVNALKTRVRDINRLLSKSDDKLPAHIRIAKERELQTTQHDLEQAQAAERRSKMIVRYHQVRFFDRQKAAKRLKRAQKRLKRLESEQDEEARRLAQAEVDELEIDINYAMYYPLDKPYSSLFPKSKSDDELDSDKQDTSGPRISKGDETLRQLVKQCMLDGRLQELREGTLTAETPAMAKETRKIETRASNVRAKGKSKPEIKKDGGQEQDSDDGFFE